MLARLGNWIREFSEDEAAAPASDTEWAQTLAGLLVEAAMADGTLDDGERQQIARVLHGELELDEADVGAKIDKAVADQQARVEIHGLTALCGRHRFRPCRQARACQAVAGRLIGPCSPRMIAIKTSARFR